MRGAPQRRPQLFFLLWHYFSVSDSCRILSSSSSSSFCCLRHQWEIKQSEQMQISLNALHPKLLYPLLTTEGRLTHRKTKPSGRLKTPSQTTTCSLRPLPVDGEFSCSQLLPSHLSISSCSRHDSSMAMRSCSSKLDATPKCPDNRGSITAL